MVEKKYIELRKVLNVCEMHYQHCLDMHDWSGDTTADNIKRDIETIPTADVVEVVRCKDCVYWENGKDYSPYCNHFASALNDTVEDDFCSYGERKTE